MKVAVEPGIHLNIRHRDGAGRPFVFVHGLSSNARLWDQVAAALPNPSWSVDLRGHGDSDLPEHGHDTATAADDVAIVIGALELDRPVVVGQSWGGNVVVRLAAKHPELIHAIGLVDGGWIDLPSLFADWEACERALAPSEINGVPVTRMRDWMTNSHPDWSAEAIEATLANMRVLPDGTVERRLPIDKHLMILRSLWDEPPTPDLPQIAAPALLLPAMGPDDAKAPAIVAAAGVMKKASITWYPQSNHDLHAQHPVRLAADLAALAA